MRVQSFSNLLLEYDIIDLVYDDSERTALLENLPFSVIVEGEWTELENLEKWISISLDRSEIKELFHVKTGYDFGFTEYFFADSISMEATIQAIPRIYTLYPHSLTPEQACRSIGYESYEYHDSTDKTAIIFPPDEEK
jgi:hypothetical protein